MLLAGQIVYIDVCDATVIVLSAFKRELEDWNVVTLDQCANFAALLNDQLDLVENLLACSALLHPNRCKVKLLEVGEEFAVTGVLEDLKELLAERLAKVQVIEFQVPELLEPALRQLLHESQRRIPSHVANDD